MTTNIFAGFVVIMLTLAPPALWTAHGAISQQAYLKASNPDGGEVWPGAPGDEFGHSVAIWGNTIVVGAPNEDSNATGVNGNQNDNSATDSGAVYVFVRQGTTWRQEAYLKASNAEAGDQFGHWHVGISGDTIVVGAPGEASNATGINGDQSNNDAGGSGAAYVFVRDGTNWIQQAYLKASNAEAGDLFGRCVAISGDTIVVGASGETSNATGVNGDQSNNDIFNAGAAYIFVRQGTNWTQQAYLKASNPQERAYFGTSAAVSGDTVVIGAFAEGNSAGAAYVFTRTGTNWSQQAYLKASNAQGRDSVGIGDSFGISVSVSDDTVVIGANGEASNATGVNGNQSDNSAAFAGAVYVFVRSGTNWPQQAYLKASNTEYSDQFGSSVSIWDNTLVVGAAGESSSATGVNGNQLNNSAYFSGAAYVFARNGTNWAQQAYLKASNTGGESTSGDVFGARVAVSWDTVVITAYLEDSSASGVNGNQNDNSAMDSGAAYVFRGFGHGPTLAVAPDGSGGYFLRVNGAPSVRYFLLRARSVNGPWSTIAVDAAPASGFIEFHDTNPPPGQAFYRTAQP